MQPTKLDDKRTPHGLPDIAEDSELQGFNYAQVNVGGSDKTSDKPVPVTATIDQRNSNNRNDHLPWLQLNAIIGTAALMGVLIMLWKGPEYLAAIAEARVAKAEANSELARKEASNAMDLVDMDRAKRKALEELKK